MSTYTSTSTYTVADVEKVMRSVKADLIMIASSTKAMTETRHRKRAENRQECSEALPCDRSVLRTSGEEEEMQKRRFDEARKR